MTWCARPICMDCQRVIHGPGTGVVGPVYSEPVKPGGVFAKATVSCALCLMPASPFNTMRLWSDEDNPSDSLDAWADEDDTLDEWAEWAEKEGPTK